MTKIDTGGPASPATIFERDIEYGEGGPDNTVSHDVDYPGKTWLDDAAMRIAAALVSNSPYDWKMGEGSEKVSLAKWVADQSYGYAQALLAEKRRLEEDGSGD